MPIAPPIPFCFWKTSGPSWPTGSDGNLVINGTTTTIDCRTVPVNKNYNNVTITNSGVLNVLGGNWFSFGVNGTITVDGTSKIQAISDSTSYTAGQSIVYTATAPDGTALSNAALSLIQPLGGQGGTDGSSMNNSPLSSYGGGTGGSSRSNAGNSDSSIGDGGNGGATVNLPEAIGGSAPFGNGADGNGTDTYGVNQSEGSPGAGGAKGWHAGNVYAKWKTVAISSSAQILIGQSLNQGGGSGGQGSDADASASLIASGGGGGAGGAGGNGGKFQGKTHAYTGAGNVASNAALLAIVSVSGGSGGIGGVGGIGNPSAALDGGDGQVGTNGDSGANGSAAVTNY